MEELPQSADGFYRSTLLAAIRALRTTGGVGEAEHESPTSEFRVGLAYAALLFHELRSIEIGTHPMDVRNLHAPRGSDLGGRACFFDWFFRNQASLYQAYQALASGESKRLFLQLLIHRLAGHDSIEISAGYLRRKNEYAHYKNAERFTESELPLSGAFGRLRHYDFKYDGRHYIADCLDLEYYLFRRQYFFSSQGVEIAPRGGDIVIDGGACTGDTALVFSNVVGPEGKVYSFDPVADHLGILSFNIRRFPFRNVIAMPYGLSDRNVKSDPILLSQYSPGFNSRNQSVPLRSIDTLVYTGEIPRVDFIKLDIEGAERDALVGARQSILDFKPKLAISLYHKPDDLFELINFVSREFPFYRLYMDNYTGGQLETVLYCTPVLAS
jgi:FkbM family methyltransferase